MGRKAQKKFFLSFARKMEGQIFWMMLQKIRGIIISSRLAGTVISRKMVIAIGTSFIKSNEPKKFEGILWKS